MTDFDVRRVCEFELEMLREELKMDPNNIEVQERIIEITDLLNTIEDQFVESLEIGGKSMPKRLIDWFDKNVARWLGTCTACGEQYIHRGTEPTQTRCRKKDCDGTIIWQIDEV